MRTHRGGDGHNADCLKSKAELPIMVAWLSYLTEGER